LVSSFLLKCNLDLERSEGVLTNRAIAYIKVKKYKEALQDCEHALSINPKFSKAHMRAYTCYVQTGEFRKADEALKKATELGDETAAKNKQWVSEYIKYEDFANKALAQSNFQEAKFYFKRILESATDSVKHTCLLLETLVSENPNDMTDSVSYTTKV
jgi:tetratricopeptide (TPR) repeat protein